MADIHQYLAMQQADAPLASAELDIHGRVARQGQLRAIFQGLAAPLRRRGMQVGQPVARRSTGKAQCAQQGDCQGQTEQSAPCARAWSRNLYAGAQPRAHRPALLAQCLHLADHPLHAAQGGAVAWVGLQPGVELTRLVGIQFTLAQAQGPFGSFLFDTRGVHGSAMSSVRWQWIRAWARYLRTMRGEICRRLAI
ncbi:hypothetical protein D3C80_1177290 [compost metagenome]